MFQIIRIVAIISLQIFTFCSVFAVSGEKLPFLKAITLGPEINFNRNDLMAGTSLGLQSNFLNTSLYVGYNIRVKPKEVYIEHGYNMFYKYREGRSFLYFSLEKRFGYEFLYAKAGVLLALKAVYTFGSYRDVETGYEGHWALIPNYLKENEKQIFIPPSIGIFWMNPNAIVKIAYENIDLRMPVQPEYTSVIFPVVSNHRIVFSFVYCFNFSRNVGF